MDRRNRPLSLLVVTTSLCVLAALASAALAQAQRGGPRRGLDRVSGRNMRAIVGKIRTTLITLGDVVPRSRGANTEDSITEIWGEGFSRHHNGLVPRGVLVIGGGGMGKSHVLRAVEEEVGPSTGEGGTTEAASARHHVAILDARTVHKDDMNDEIDSKIAGIVSHNDRLTAGKRPHGWPVNE